MQFGLNPFFEKGALCMDIFEGLSERQREAVETIDDDLEIIACAGAGKTGVVTRRIVNILKLNPGVLPENIVAFTFTKKAAEELKGRINAYGKSVLGHTKDSHICMLEQFMVFA